VDKRIQQSGPEIVRWLFWRIVGFWVMLAAVSVSEGFYLAWFAVGWVDFALRRLMPETYIDWAQQYVLWIALAAWLLLSVVAGGFL